MINIAHIVKTGLKKTAVNLIRIYQGYVRRVLPSACRFTPTCSEYAKEAITRYGLFKGTLKGIKRILCCQPLSQKSGYDPLV